MKILSLFSLIIFLALQAVPQALAARVIAIGSPIVEIICALGQEKQLIARSSWDTFPPSIQKLPEIGSPFNPNLERILFFKPDMIILGSEMGMLADELKKYRIPCIIVSAYNRTDIIPAIDRLAEIFQCETQGKLLKAELQKIEKVLQEKHEQQSTHSLPPKQGIHFTQSNSLYAVTSLSGSTLLQDARAKNLADITQNPYPHLSKEWLLCHQADFFLIPMREKNQKESQEQSIRFFGKKIIQKTTCIFMDEKLTYGLRSCLGSLLLATKLYPEYYTNISYTETEENFLKKFFPSALNTNKENNHE